MLNIPFRPMGNPSLGLGAGSLPPFPPTQPRPRSRFRCCRKEKPPPQPVRRKKAGIHLGINLGNCWPDAVCCCWQPFHPLVNSGFLEGKKGNTHNKYHRKILYCCNYQLYSLFFLRESNKKSEKKTSMLYTTSPLHNQPPTRLFGCAPPSPKRNHGEMNNWTGHSTLGWDWLFSVF